MAQSPFTFLTRGPKTVDLPTAAEVAALLEVSRYDAPGRHGDQYEPASGANAGWNLHDALYPFTDYPAIARGPITNASMLDVKVLGYTYDEL
jgi:hypothetical protein